MKTVLALLLATATAAAGTPPACPRIPDVPAGLGDLGCPTAAKTLKPAKRGSQTVQIELTYAGDIDTAYAAIAKALTANGWKKLVRRGAQLSARYGHDKVEMTARQAATETIVTLTFIPA